MGGRRKIIITCEHAGNYVPKDFKLLFLGKEEVLDTHRAFDPGSFAMARYLSKNLHAPVFYQKLCRLIIEVNRSKHHPQLFSVFTGKLDEYVKKLLIEKYYDPYRNSVEQKIEEEIKTGHAVLHLSIHSFTPVLNDIERKVDIGILFDDIRPKETLFAEQWKDELTTLLPDLTILHNVPYHGADDGFTTYLRTKFNGDQYLGFEIEINQKFVNTTTFRVIEKGLMQSIKKLEGTSASVH